MPLRKYTSMNDIINIDKSSSSSVQKTIFTLGSYYNKDKKIEEIRHKVEKNRFRNMLSDSTF